MTDRAVFPHFGTTILTLDDLGKVIDVNRPKTYQGDVNTWVDPNDQVYGDRLADAKRVDRDLVSSMLVNSVRKGKTGTEAADEIRDYLTPAASKSRTTPITPFSGKGSGRFRTLARTEAVRANGLATIEASILNPFVDGVRWNLSARHPKTDQCDINAHEKTSNKLPGGVYDPADVPLYPDHPNCLCFLSPEVLKSTKKIIQDLLRRENAPLRDSPFIVSKNIDEATNFAREVLGVEAQYGDDLQTANLANRVLWENKEVGFRNPARIEIRNIDGSRAGDDVNAYAQYRLGSDTIEINSSEAISRFWENDLALARENPSNWFSGRGREHVLRHELGHSAHFNTNPNLMHDSLGMRFGPNWWKLAGEVSMYGQDSPGEFVAEVYAGKLVGKNYSRAVDALYAAFDGPLPPGQARPTRSEIESILGRSIPKGRLPDAVQPSNLDRAEDILTKTRKIHDTIDDVNDARDIIKEIGDLLDSPNNPEDQITLINTILDVLFGGDGATASSRATRETNIGRFGRSNDSFGSLTDDQLIARIELLEEIKRTDPILVDSYRNLIGHEVALNHELQLREGITGKFSYIMTSRPPKDELNDMAQRILNPKYRQGLRDGKLQPDELIFQDLTRDLYLPETAFRERVLDLPVIPEKERVRISTAENNRIRKESVDRWTERRINNRDQYLAGENYVSGIPMYTTQPVRRINSGVVDYDSVFERVKDYHATNPKVRDIQTKALLKYDAALDEMFQGQALDRDLTLFRAVSDPDGFSPHLYTNLEEGDEFIDWGFTSTSTNPHVWDFTFLSDKADRHLEIRVPRGTPGEYFSSLPNAHTTEREVVLGPGTRFKIVGRSEDTIGRESIVVDVIPESNEIRLARQKSTNPNLVEFDKTPPFDPSAFLDDTASASPFDSALDNLGKTPLQEFRERLTDLPTIKLDDRPIILPNEEKRIYAAGRKFWRELEHDNPDLANIAHEYQSGLWMTELNPLIRKYGSLEIAEVNMDKPELILAKYGKNVISKNHDLEELLRSDVLDTDLTLYRGIRNQAGEDAVQRMPIFGDFQEGDEFIDWGIVSTGVDPRVLDNFINYNNPITMEIRVPKGTPARYFRPLDLDYKDQYEMVLPPGGRYKIVGKGVIKGRDSVVVDFIPEPAPVRTRRLLSDNPHLADIPEKGPAPVLSYDIEDFIVDNPDPNSILDPIDRLLAFGDETASARSVSDLERLSDKELEDLLAYWNSIPDDKVDVRETIRIEDILEARKRNSVDHLPLIGQADRPPTPQSAEPKIFNEAYDFWREVRTEDPGIYNAGHGYVAGNFRLGNLAKRANGGLLPEREFGAYYQDLNSELERMFRERASDEDRTLYRALSNRSGLPNPLYDSLQEGDEFIDWGFASTSLDSKIFNDPVTRLADRHVEIRVPRGTPSEYFAPLGIHHEQEMLLGPGTRYRIVGRGEAAGKKTVVLDLIPEDEATRIARQTSDNPNLIDFETASASGRQPQGSRINGQYLPPANTMMIPGSGRNLPIQEAKLEMIPGYRPKLPRPANAPTGLMKEFELEARAKALKHIELSRLFDVTMLGDVPVSQREAVRNIARDYRAIEQRREARRLGLTPNYLQSSPVSRRYQDPKLPLSWNEVDRFGRIVKRTETKQEWQQRLARNPLASPDLGFFEAQKQLFIDAKNIFVPPKGEPDLPFIWNSVTGLPRNRQDQIWLDRLDNIAIWHENNNLDDVVVIPRKGDWVFVDHEGNLQVGSKETESIKHETYRLIQSKQDENLTVILPDRPINRSGVVIQRKKKLDPNPPYIKLPEGFTDKFPMSPAVQERDLIRGLRSGRYVMMADNSKDFVDVIEPAKWAEMEIPYRRIRKLNGVVIKSRPETEFSKRFRWHTSPTAAASGARRDFGTASARPQGLVIRDILNGDSPIELQTRLQTQTDTQIMDHLRREGLDIEDILVDNLSFPYGRDLKEAQEIAKKVGITNLDVGFDWVTDKPTYNQIVNQINNAALEQIMLGQPRIQSEIRVMSATEHQMNFGGPVPKKDSLGHYRYDPSNPKSLKSSSLWFNPELKAYWKDEYGMELQKRSGSLAYPDRLGVIVHEMGHQLHHELDPDKFVNSKDDATWKQLVKDLDIRNSVSGYAAKSPQEFVAEMYAGIRSGDPKYLADDLVALYQMLGGYWPWP